MRIAVSGTYSAGKTITSMALAHLCGLPRPRTKTMRELLPISIPGKRLDDCTAAELIMLIMRRSQERAVNESHVPDGFISDGSSLHEWAYGMIRVLVGINPSASTTLENQEMSDEIRFYADVLEQMGVPAKQHAKAAYDSFVHLPIEFPLVADGHRPVNERFRAMAEDLMLATLDELEIPYHVVGGTLGERLQKIMDIYGFAPRMSVEQAIVLAREEYATVDVTPEDERVDAAR